MFGSTLPNNVAITFNVKKWCPLPRSSVTSISRPNWDIFSSWAEVYSWEHTVKKNRHEWGFICFSYFEWEHHLYHLYIYKWWSFQLPGFTGTASATLRSSKFHRKLPAVASCWNRWNHQRQRQNRVYILLNYWQTYTFNIIWYHLISFNMI